jgi:hypothetical protein
MSKKLTTKPVLKAEEAIIKNVIARLPEGEKQGAKKALKAATKRATKEVKKIRVEKEKKAKEAKEAGQLTKDQKDGLRKFASGFKQISKALYTYFDRKGMAKVTLDECLIIALEVKPDSAFNRWHFHFHRKVYRNRQAAAKLVKDAKHEAGTDKPKKTKSTSKSKGHSKKATA